MLTRGRTFSKVLHCMNLQVSVTLFKSPPCLPPPSSFTPKLVVEPKLQTTIFKHLKIGMPAKDELSI